MSTEKVKKLGGHRVRFGDKVYHRPKWLVSKETLCCVGGQVKQLVDYQLEVDKGKLTAVANLKS